MYDEICRHLDQRIDDGLRVRIARAAPEDADRKRAMPRLSAYVKTELERHITEMFDERDAAEAASQPQDEVRAFGGLRTRRQLEKYFVERFSAEISRPIQTLNLVVPAGTALIGPPYDHSWSQGNGRAFVGHVRPWTIPKANGFSAAGQGFYLTTNEPALVTITPWGSYEFAWSALEDLPFARSRGGMGLTIYTNAEEQPTLSRQAVLWNVSGVTNFSRGEGSGRIADAASPAFGFGTVRLAPALLNMVPGSRYLVWVWCWQTAMLQDSDPFFAVLSFFMPLVLINSGPPIVIR